MARRSASAIVRRWTAHPGVVRVTSAARRTLAKGLGRPPLPAGTLEATVERFQFTGGTLTAQGWAFNASKPIVAVGLAGPTTRRLAAGYGVVSPDVAGQHGSQYARCRFLVQERWPSPEEAAATQLFVRYADGSEEPMTDAVMAALLRDRYGMPWARFLEHLRTTPPGRVLELGSRGEQGTLYRDALPPSWTYTGFDIEPGHNVDVVGDAHELSRHVEAESLDALLSVATFEHLAMPWKVAVEINKVLKPGGVAVLVSHQCWPVHEQPWDFWRFSTWAWRAMFNEASGFEVLEAVMGEPARVVPELLQPVTAGVADGVAYLGSAALVRKIGPTALSWEVPTEAAAEGSYPVP